MRIFFILSGFVILIIAAAYLCCRLAFSVKKQSPEDTLRMPDTGQYRPYAEQARAMIQDALAVPYEEVTITSCDGLKLYGKYYAAEPDAPWLILFHGYRSSAERDFCGGLKFGRESGFNVLLVDQRAHGKSEGKYLTMGIKERYDCLSWVAYVCQRTENRAKIVLYGISMGAATVLMSTALNLPSNVRGIVADCGYSSPSDIIKIVLKKMHYPKFPVYALLRLGGRLFAGFDIEAASASAAMEACHIPVLLIHGEEDHFVPCDMSRENFRCCRSSMKRLLTIPDAGHGISYMVDRKTYLDTVTDFLKKI